MINCWLLHFTQTAAWLQKREWEVLQHLPHSPDLVPSDFYPFRPFKNVLTGKRFEDFTSLGKEHSSLGNREYGSRDPS
jgi:hypothetical protein